MWYWGGVKFEPSFVSPLTKVQQRPEAGIFFFTRGFYYYSNACIVKDLWRNGRNTPKNCIFWKNIVERGGGSYYSLGLDGGWFFGPWVFIIPKSSYQDLSNEGSNFFWVHWNLFFKLLKHGHFLINFRFWLVWVELRKNKALSSVNFLQIGSCPQLLNA